MVARLGLAVVTAAACFFGGRALLAHQLATAPPVRLALPPLPDEARRDLALVHGEGQVERGTAEGGFAAAPRGAPLAAGETLRVGGGARATLRIGVASAIALEAGAELTALPAASGEVALRLDHGRARVTLSHPERVLRVASPDGGEVIARGGPGTRFLVAVHPGRLALINEDGSAPVRLSAAGAEVEVPANRASWSVQGGAPRPPIEPPSEPGLEIAGTALAAAERPPDAEAAPAPAEADGTPPADALVVVTGRAHPLALVRIGAAVVDVAADGSFEARLPRQAEPYAVLASLPTGSEALLEVPAPSTDARPEEAAPEVPDAPVAAGAAQGAAAAPTSPPVVEEPPAPKPKARKKRAQRTKKARTAQKASGSKKARARTSAAVSR